MRLKAEEDGPETLDRRCESLQSRRGYGERQLPDENSLTNLAKEELWSTRYRYTRFVFKVNLSLAAFVKICRIRHGINTSNPEDPIRDIALATSTPPTPALCDQHPYPPEYYTQSTARRILEYTPSAVPYRQRHPQIRRPDSTSPRGHPMSLLPVFQMRSAR